VSNNDELKSIMERYGLTKEQISELTNSSVHTVTAWLSSSNAKKYRNMTDRAMKLLKFEIRDQGLKRK
jgi:DNA-binding transcriptional regulator YiaG